MDIIEHLKGAMRAYEDEGDIAVGVSGGPDSMALAYALCAWVDELGGAFNVHLLTIDHGLRPESSQEARQVQRIVSSWPCANHVILEWEGEKPNSRVQEEARKARYHLMSGYCAAHNISHLCLAHHRDDQAETFLLRLSKGSGLDGLAGMRNVQFYDENLSLLRPFLDISKHALLAFCQEQNIQYFYDPSNENDAFARPRLRASKGVLEEEGLTAKRLSVTAKRLGRAKDALNQVSDVKYKKFMLIKNSIRIEFDINLLACEHEEIVLRVLVKAMWTLCPDMKYLPRMERIESLVCDLLRADIFRKRTLGHLLFERDDVTSRLIIQKETGA